MNKTPDYRLKLGATSAVAEVKQLDPNSDDLEALQELERTGHMEGVPQRARVRDMITKGYPQLKDSAEHGVPGILVLYDNIAGLINNLCSFTVSTAMFGDYAIALDQTSSGEWKPAASKFGKKRKLTRDYCKGISAIAVLDDRRGAAVALTAYHNPFSINPIPYVDMALIANEQFAYDDPHGEGFVGLEPRKIELD